MRPDAAAAVAALPAGPLTEAALQAHIAPLFTRHLHGMGERVYLANHSLGRPLDATHDDVVEGLEAWYAAMGGAWDAWESEGHAHRARYARLLNAPRVDCLVPKTSAGQGLRAVLNALPGAAPRVIATHGEFDSLDVILRVYAQRGRIALQLVGPGADGLYATADILAAIVPGVQLVVVSEVIFNTGQRLADLAAIVGAAHAVGARVLLDVYHSLGVFPVDVAALDVDFAVGGGYKYLRGGPGACFVYLAPRVLDERLVTLDTGWFAKADPFTYARPDPPQLAAGGDAWLESTPPVLTWYQARAGAELVIALGVERIREHSLRLQRELCALLAALGVPALGGTAERGAFVVVRDPLAPALSTRLAAKGIVTDARGAVLRLCPDLLTTAHDLERAADALAAARRT